MLGMNCRINLYDILAWYKLIQKQPRPLLQKTWGSKGVQLTDNPHHPNVMHQSFVSTACRSMRVGGHGGCALGKFNSMGSGHMNLSNYMGGRCL